MPLCLRLASPVSAHPAACPAPFVYGFTGGRVGFIRRDGSRLSKSVGEQQQCPAQDSRAKWHLLRRRFVFPLPVRA
ncbi:hypothetical protein VTO73DRAFT_14506 [Trametes versicolor]